MVHRLVRVLVLAGVVAVSWSSVAHAYVLERQGATSVLTITSADKPETLDPTTGWGDDLPRIQIAPDLYGNGWFACRTCGAPIEPGELVIRTPRRIVVVIEDPGRMANPATRLAVRLEATTPKAADGSAIELNFDRGDVVRDDTLTVRGRDFDVGGDGTIDVDLVDVRLRATSIWMGPGDDTLDARGSTLILDEASLRDTRWESSYGVGITTGRIQMGRGDDTVYAPERITDHVDLGPDDDHAIVGSDLDPKLNFGYSSAFDVTLGGGADVVDATRFTRSLHVHSDRHGTAERITGGTTTVTYGGRAGLQVISTAVRTTVTAMRARHAGVYATSRELRVRTGAGSDDVQAFSTRRRLAIADIDTGAGNDDVSLYGVLARGTTGPGRDLLSVAPSSPVFFIHGFRTSDVRGFSCGADADSLVSGAYTVTPDGTSPMLPIRQRVRGCEQRDVIPPGRQVAWEGQLLSAFHLPTPGEPDGLRRNPYEGDPADVQVVSADAARVVLRPGVRRREIEFTASMQGGVARWSCSACPDIPATASVQLQLQHPLAVTLRVPVGIPVAPIEVQTIARRAHWSTTTVVVSGAAAVTVIGTEVLDHGRRLVRHSGVLPTIVRVETGASADVIDLRQADPTIRWTADSGAGADVLTGSPGDDWLVSDGAARNRGLAGADTISILGAGRADGGAGPDRLIAMGPLASLYGGPGNDSLESRRGSRVMAGGDGDDSIHGYFGNDTMYGGRGNDGLSKRGRTGWVRMYAGDGRDTLQTREGLRVRAADCGAGNDAAILSGVDGRGAFGARCEILHPKVHYYWQYRRWNPGLTIDPYGTHFGEDYIAPLRTPPSYVDEPDANAPPS